MSFSRRRLFGLLAGAAAAPVLGRVSLGEEMLPPAPPIPNPDIMALLQRRMADANAAMIKNISERLYGDGMAVALFDSEAADPWRIIPTEEWLMPAPDQPPAPSPETP